jgi:biopolymer transport protein TolQ
MGPNPTILSYFTHADLVVKMVMAILLLGSVFSWLFIFQRYFYLKSAELFCNKFESTFWASENLSQLFSSLEMKKTTLSGLSNIFYHGFKSFIAQKKDNNPHGLENITRAMRVALLKEHQKLERHLPFLATVASVSPYIGLFGTVWGIMNAFSALGQVQQATIAMVAPGISEALVATAMGLFAAIPAVLAYNRYTNDVEKLSNQYQMFQEELTAILDRQLVQ